MKTEKQRILEELKNTKDYENLKNILGKKLGGLLYRFIDLCDCDER